VQVLIVIDFLLSLSPKAKEKLSKATLPDNPNKSVMYADQVLNEEDVSSLRPIRSLFHGTNLNRANGPWI
jgi:THO complex subunit 1